MEKGIRTVKLNQKNQIWIPSEIGEIIKGYNNKFYMKKEQLELDSETYNLYVLSTKRGKLFNIKNPRISLDKKIREYLKGQDNSQLTDITFLRVGYGLEMWNKTTFEKYRNNERLNAQLNKLTG